MRVGAFVCTSIGVSTPAPLLLPAIGCKYTRTRRGTLPLGVSTPAPLLPAVIGCEYTALLLPLAMGCEYTLTAAAAPGSPSHTPVQLRR